MQIESAQLLFYITKRFLPLCEQTFEQRDHRKKYFQEMPNLMIQAQRQSTELNKEYRFVVVADGWPDIDRDYTKAYADKRAPT